MAWRLALALIDLRDEVNTRWPKRDKASDGTIGDAAHATRSSDHNPWVIDDNGVGVVRAVDTDVDGINAAWLAEHVRLLGADGDRRLTNGGYVIFNRRITRPDFSGWAYYSGVNPHTQHVHISFSRTGYDRRGDWGISERKDWLDMVSEAEWKKLREDVAEVKKILADPIAYRIGSTTKKAVPRSVWANTRTDAWNAKVAARDAAADDETGRS